MNADAAELVRVDLFARRPDDGRRFNALHLGLGRHKRRPINHVGGDSSALVGPLPGNGADALRIEDEEALAGAELGLG